MIWRSLDPNAKERAGGPKQGPKDHLCPPERLKFQEHIAPSKSSYTKNRPAELPKLPRTTDFSRAA